MAIPKIQSYSMPANADLPENKVNWQVDPAKAVLLIHDMQQYFVDAFTPQESPVTELVANITRLREAAHQLGIPVIYSAQPGGQTLEQRGLLQDFWGSGIDDGSEQKRIIAELEPSDQDTVLTKWRYSAFQKTNLLEQFRQMGRDQMMITGIYAHIGCLLTAAEAYMQEIKPFYVADAVADFSEDYHKLGLKYASERCAMVVSTEQLVDELQGIQAQKSTVSDNQWSSEQLRNQIANLMGIDKSELSDHEDLTLLGLDSIRIMTLVEEWRSSGMEITFVDLLDKPTIAEWSEMLTELARAGELAEVNKSLPNLDYMLK
ncbi:isochorismatase [Paenibacillus sp. FSL H7-0326]|uniref:isochorismatase family protein n=1 Tax=Paenibacillus sp. FSL H7-0326 TaxID=1921144 RepID=UPI00096C296F|nr:isochorismatase family protein [Paenibacillus sp. FSL H7-0326]OMC70787.1 isochorismatase [Paenibacillus sp. FSL H7-0326]